MVDEKWGPSIGLFQIRSLKDPLGFSVPDRFRYAWALRHPCYNAAAAYAISKAGTDWTPWTVYRNDRYLEFAGIDYKIRTGHVRSDLWNS